MKRIMCMCLSLLLAGCATTQYVAPIDTTFSDTVKDLPRIEGVVVQELPELPTAVKTYDSQGVPHVGFTVEGADRLRELRAKAEANTELANDLLRTAQSLQAERDSVARLGRMEEARANYLAQQWKMQAEEADRQRSERKWSEWGNRVMTIAAFLLLR